MPITGDATVITIRALSITDPVYSISGYIVDGADDGINDVLVTLSGDASDTFTTGEAPLDGYYQFDDLSNGDYVVTPTKSGYYFTADHEDVTIAYDNEIADDMVGAENLILPYTYNMSDVVPSSGSVASQLSDWTAYQAFDGGSIATTTADANSYTPSGVTKVFYVPWAATKSLIINDLPSSIDPSLTSLRFSFLTCDSANPSRVLSMNMTNVTAAQMNAGTPASTGYASVYWGTNFNPDEIDTAARYGTETVYREFNNTSTGRNDAGDRWVWVRCEYDFVAETVTVSVYRVEDSSTFFTSSTAMDAAGITYGHVPTGLKTVFFAPYDTTSNGKIAKFWVGTTSDAWPT